MQVICLEDEAFYTLIEEVIARLKEKHNLKEDKWHSADQAMEKLKIKSKTTLQKLRDSGRIRYSQPEKKLILYNADSINEYLEKHAKNLFDMDDQQEKQFITSFNNGYLLAKNLPELMLELIKNLTPTNEYFQGFFSGSRDHTLQATMATWKILEGC